MTENSTAPLRAAPLVASTGKSETLLSSPLAKNIPLYALVEAALEAPHPVPHEGRIAIVTDVGRGMRWTLMVLLTNSTEADGEVVWF